MGSIITQSASHVGTSFVEIYQNCNIFNDGAFNNLTDRDKKLMSQLVLEDGEPMLFGPDKNFGIKLEGPRFKAVELGPNLSIDDVLVHDTKNKNLAVLLSEMTYDEDLPVPIGVLYEEEKLTYNDMMVAQIKAAVESKGNQKLQTLIDGPETWLVK